MSKNSKEEIMRVACMTYVNNYNYGTYLQSYALQKVVSDMDCVNEYSIINYTGGTNKLLYKPLKFEPNKGIAYNTAKIFISPYSLYRAHMFRQFSQRYLSYTREYKEKEDLFGLNSKYDLFICGSDAIWQNHKENNDDAYFLSFVDRRKIAYAPSAAKMQSETADIDKYRRYIPEFDAVSVRDASTFSFAQPHTLKNVEIVLDPTLLLSREQWEKISIKPRIKSPYILVYNLSDVAGNKVVHHFIDTLKKQTGYKVIKISTGPKVLFKDRAYRIPSPQEWLGLMENAAFVVTSSFHGTIFAMLFHKTFYTFAIGGSMSGNNMKKCELCEKFDLCSQLLDGSFKKDIDISPINYDDVDRILGIERRKSITWITEAVQQGNIIR